MKKTARYSSNPLALTLALLAASGMSGVSAAEESSLGKLGTTQIKYGEFKKLVDADVPEVRTRLANSSQDLDRAVRLELVRRALLAEARAKGWDKKPEVTLQMDRARDQALVTAYVNAMSRPSADYPAEADVRAAYDGNRQQFTVPVRFRVAQIFVKQPEGDDRAKAEAGARKAEDLARQAQARNANFAEIAKAQSEHAASATNGGDLGWLAEGEMIPEVRPAVTALQPGQVSAVVKSPQGWHILRLVERKEASVRPLEEVRPDLVALLRLRKAQENEQKFLSEMTTRNPISVDDAELKKLQAALK